MVMRHWYLPYWPISWPMTSQSSSSDNLAFFGGVAGELAAAEAVGCFDEIDGDFEELNMITGK